MLYNRVWINRKITKPARGHLNKENEVPLLQMHRASHGQDLEIAECFVLLSVVYGDDGEDTFKLADKYL